MISADLICDLRFAICFFDEIWSLSLPAIKIKKSVKVKTDLKNS